MKGDMAEIRLSKLTKQFSIGLARLVEFLNEKGANVEMNPNAKISDEYLPAIEAKFGEELQLKIDSARVTIKLKEIIELQSHKATSQNLCDKKFEDDIVIKDVISKSKYTNSIGINPSQEQGQSQLSEAKGYNNDIDSIEMDFNWEID
jgi:hypothetical protein